MTRPEVLTLPELLAHGRGVACWTQLEAAGVTRSQLRSAVSSGVLRRLRRGWYATTWADADVVTAVAAGGVLGCVSALRLHGVWVPPDRRLHIRAGVSATRADTAGRLCRQYGRPEPEAGSIDGSRHPSGTPCGVWTAKALSWCVIRSCITG